MEPTERPGGRTGVDDQGTIAMTLPELTLRYLADPDPRTLRKLREHVRAAPSFDRYAVIPTPSQRITADEALQVVTDIVDRMPGWFLSPRAHAGLAAAYAELGDNERAEQESVLTRLAVSSVLSSGAGTAEQPWIVLRVADEYDVLAALGCSSTRQELVTLEGRTLDRHSCDDGQERWFDVSPDEPPSETASSPQEVGS
ncbi:MAG TPA: DUF4919 domain-containing protein [Phycicoccus elongatus]|jgi:hypothetical protein|nr:DUF4919 domain-containing protein [Phycicoccus elongatus]